MAKEKEMSVSKKCLRLISILKRGTNGSFLRHLMFLATFLLFFARFYFVVMRFFVILPPQDITDYV